VRSSQKILGRKKPEAAFTLVELLVVIVILAVLTAVVMPKFVNQGVRTKEAALKSDLRLVRTAVYRFYSDTSLYPDSLETLAVSEAPAEGLDKYGMGREINKLEWQGPYLESIPTDPVSGGDFLYFYKASDGRLVGEVRSSAQGNGSDGTPYIKW